MNASVTIPLTEDEALVLFEWLAKLHASGPVQGEAEQRVLWSVEAALERTLAAPLSANYHELVAAARARLLGA